MEVSWEHGLKDARRSFKRRIKTAKKSLQKASAHLESCQKWRRQQHLATLLQANLYQIPKRAKEVTVWDWEENQSITIELDPLLKPHEEVAKRFKKAKKLQTGLVHAERELKRAQDYFNTLESQKLELEQISSEEQWAEWQKVFPERRQKKQASESKKTPAKPYWEYFSQGQIPIWVGKNAVGNDALTFQHARGNDPWLHVTEFPGSHVVIHLPAQCELDQETLKDALQLALYHSKAKARKEAEVSFTHVKFIKRFGREKGKVQIAHEQRFLVRMDPERLELTLRTREMRRS